MADPFNPRSDVQTVSIQSLRSELKLRLLFTAFDDKLENAFVVLE